MSILKFSRFAEQLIFIQHWSPEAGASLPNNCLIDSSGTETVGFLNTSIDLYDCNFGKANKLNIKSVVKLILELQS